MKYEKNLIIFTLTFIFFLFLILFVKKTTGVEFRMAHSTKNDLWCFFQTLLKYMRKNVESQNEKFSRLARSGGEVRLMNLWSWMENFSFFTKRILWKKGTKFDDFRNYLNWIFTALEIFLENSLQHKCRCKDFPKTFPIDLLVVREENSIRLYIFKENSDVKYGLTWVLSRAF